MSLLKLALVSASRSPSILPSSRVSLVALTTMLAVVGVSGSSSASGLPAGDSAVADLCRIAAPKKGGQGWAKQRLVIFSLDGQDVTELPEKEVNEKGEELKGVEHHVFRASSVHNHLRNVFFSTFPMERFHTVVAQLTAPPSLLGKRSVSAEEMVRAAELDPFAAYSIACADWVMAPRVVGKTATWRKVKKQRQEGKKTVEFLAWEVSTQFEIEVAVYEFKGGAWTLAGTAKDSGSGVMDTSIGVADLGHTINDVVSGGAGKEQKSLVSAQPDTKCRVPLADDLKDIADNFGKCGEATVAATSSASTALRLNENPPEDTQEPTPDKAAPGQGGMGSGGAASVAGAGGAASGKAGSAGGAGRAPVAGAASDSAPAAEPEKEVLDEVGRGALVVASGGNPKEGLKDLAKQAVAENAPEGMVEAVGAAKVAVETCQASVESVVKSTKRLREIAQNPVGAAKNALLGFAACSGVPLSYDLGNATPPGTAQLHSTFCEDMDKKGDVTRGQAAMQDVAVCQSRVSSERATLMVQKIIKTFPGIKIEVPLLPPVPSDSPYFGLAVGREDGIKRGDMFQAKDPRGNRIGFGYVVKQGPGGPEKGPSDPSRFRFRAGEAPLGSNMEEYPKIGLLLGARPQAGMLIQKKGLESELLFGGALDAGYNAGQFVPAGDEFWVRANVAVLVGQEDEMFLNIEMLPEAQYYLFNRVAAFVQSGVVLNLASKKVQTLVDDETLSGMSFSVALGFGLDVALHPDWNLRLSATGIQGVSKMTLENEAKTITIDAGFITSAQGGLSLDYSF
jgi:hypothetical protein